MPWLEQKTIRLPNGSVQTCWLELQKDENGNEIPCTSIFFMGRKKKEWGFVDHIRNKGYRWIHNEKYLKERSST